MSSVARTPEEYEEHLRATLRVITENATLYRRGVSDVSMVISQQLFKLLLDRDARKPALAPRVIPALRLRKFHHPPPKDSGRELPAEPGARVAQLWWPGGSFRWRPDGSFGLVVTDPSLPRVPVEAWLEQPTFAQYIYGEGVDASEDIVVTMRQLLSQARNYEGGGHYRDHVERVFDYARSMRAGAGQHEVAAYEEFLVGVAEIVVADISEQLGAQTRSAK